MEPDDRKHGRLRIHLGLVAVGALALGVVAMGCHVANPELHLWSQHWSNIYFPAPAPLALEEGWCLDVTSQLGSPPVPPAPSEPNGLVVGARISDALTGNDTLDWQDVPPGRMHFVLVGGCDSFDSTTSPTRGDINIEYHVTSNASTAPCNLDYSVTPPAPGSNDVSCVYHDPNYVTIWPDGHRDRRYAYAILDVDNIPESIYRHTVNHETGHVLGLSDPEDGAGITDFSRVLAGLEIVDNCRVQVVPGLVLWVDSIMHAPPSYCVAYGQYREWPTSADRNKVISISVQEGQ